MKALMPLLQLMAFILIFVMGTSLIATFVKLTTLLFNEVQNESRIHH